MSLLEFDRRTHDDCPICKCWDTIYHSTMGLFELKYQADMFKCLLN